MNMRKTSIVSVALASGLMTLSTGSAEAQTTAAPLPGPYLATPSQQAPTVQTFNPMNAMPVPYWMQNRQTPNAPASQSTTEAPVYPTAPQPRRQAQQFAPGWAWGAPQNGYGQGFQPYGNFPMPFQQPFYGSSPWGGNGFTPFNNGFWGNNNGFNPGYGYGYQPGYAIPGQPGY